MQASASLKKNACRSLTFYFPPNLHVILPTNRSLGLAVPIILLYAFSLALQTYVLRLDVIVAIIGLVFVGSEGLLSVGTAVSFYHAFRG